MVITQNKFCCHCKVLHPNTEEYWYDRKSWKECRIKRAITEEKYLSHYREKKTELQRTRRINNASKYKEEYTTVHRSLAGRFNSLRQNAVRRDIGIDITFEQYKDLINNPCIYCRGELPKAGGGLDRKDSSIGYTISNCVPCCKKCNLAKHVMSQSEFREWIMTVFYTLAEAGG